MHAAVVDDHGCFTTDTADGEYTRYGRRRFTNTSMSLTRNSHDISSSVSKSNSASIDPIINTVSANNNSMIKYSEVLQPVLTMYAYDKSRHPYNIPTYNYSNNNNMVGTNNNNKQQPPTIITLLDTNSYEMYLNKIWSMLKAQEWLLNSVSTARVETNPSISINTATHNNTNNVLPLTTQKSGPMTGVSKQVSTSNIWRTSSGMLYYIYIVFHI